jgi:diphthine-ammonia ligase
MKEPSSPLRRTELRPRAAVLWTGGKDCAYAFYEAVSEGIEVVALLTFVPPGAEFHAHPLEVMRSQAEAVGLPHIEAVVSQPYEEGYRRAILEAAKTLQLDVLITGDIDEVAGAPNWIRERCAGTGIEVLTPLWQRDRASLLQGFLVAGFEAVISCVRAPLTPGWLGRRLDHETVAALQDLADESAIDLSGEQGEYHTIVVDGPIFERRVQLQTKDYVEAGDLAYLRIEAAATAPR